MVLYREKEKVALNESLWRKGRVQGVTVTLNDHLIFSFSLSSAYKSQHKFQVPLGYSVVLGIYLNKPLRSSGVFFLKKMS